MIRQNPKKSAIKSSMALSVKPESKLTANLCFLLAILLTHDFKTLLVILVIQIVLAAIIPVSPLACWKGLKPFIWIIMLTAAFQALMITGETLWSWGFISISRQGVESAGFISLQLLMILLAFQLLSLTSQPAELAAGFGRILKPLQALRIPTGDLVMVMTISLSFIPLMAREARDIRQAQQARGAAFGRGNVRQRVRSWLALLVPLFSAAIRRADELAIAMEARGYIPGETGTSMHEIGLQKSDYILLTVSVGLLLIILAV